MKNGLVSFYLSIILIILGVLVLVQCDTQSYADTITQNIYQTVQHNNAINQENGTIGDDPGFKECSAHTVWRCERVIQGEYDPEGKMESVCGCVPDCPVDTVLIASSAGGRWPDNTLKGAFVCASDYPV